MKKRKVHKRAEEILFDIESTKESDINESLDNSRSEETEIDIAKGIYSSIRVKGSSLSVDERERLKKRINKSLHRNKVRKIAIYWSSAAASVALLAALSLTYYIQSKAKITPSSFSLEMEASTNPNETILILNRDSVVNIYEDLATINYNATGDIVTLNDGTIIDQKISNTSANFHTVIVPFGNRSEVILSDGSHVWLNAGSRIVFPTTFSERKRVVYLEGEAIFDVKEQDGRSFYVTTDDLEIKVLGTVFNVKAYADDQNKYAVLESGSIELKYSSNSLFGHSNTKLKPGEIAEYNSNQKKVSKKEVDTRQYTSWKDGVLVFKNDPLIDIFRKLARYYNVDIEVHETSLGTETFTGRLDLRNTPEEVLELIQLTGNFIVDQVDNHSFQIKRPLPMD